MRWLDPLVPQAVDHAARIAEAEAAAAREPADSQCHRALGDAYLAARAFEDARRAYRRARELDSGGFDRWRELAEACYFSKNPVEALATCESGLRGAADGRLHFLRGMALRKLGFADKAVPDFERALALGPNAHAPLKALLRPLSENGDPAALLDFCERLDPAHHRNALVMGYRAVALSQLGRVAEARALVDLDRHIVWKPLDPPPGYGGAAAFNDALADEILADPPDEVLHPSVAINYSVRVGPALAGLRGRVREAIEAYLADFDAMGLGSALPAPPPAATMRIGTTVLYDDGSNKQHVHPTGYVSTVYYVRIPESVRTANDDRGCLQLGACDQRAQGHAACWGERRIKPVEGWIAIFPSHVFHDVIPPLTSEPRISVPMDMEPVWDGVTRGAAADEEDSVG